MIISMTGYGRSEISRDGLTVVTTIEGSADLKRLVESLPAAIKKRS